MKTISLFIILLLGVQFSFSNTNNYLEVFSSVLIKNKNTNTFTTFRGDLINTLKNKQDSVLPFSEIPSYKDLDYTAGNIIKRTVDGLGYRYYWATEGLTQKDLDYKPSEDARTTRQTLEHLLGLSETVLNAARNTANVRPVDWSGYSFKELRRNTLENLKKASELYKNKTAEDIAKLKIIFESNGNKRDFPYWNMINGPISDALYHVGQIVSFRRSSGNPINPKVNVFIGKTGK